MENVNRFQDELKQLKVEEKQLEEILTLLRREINKYQVERMQLLSQQRLQDNIEHRREQTVEEILGELERSVNQRPLQLGSQILDISEIEEEEEDSD